jgi:hypothetical protein
MNFEEALKGELISASQDLKEITDNGVIDKVFPLNAPEGIKPPFIVYVSSEGIPDKTLQGYLNSKQVVCEIHILHGSYSDIKSLTKLVLEKIRSFQDRIIGQDGPFIQNVTYDTPTEVYEKEVYLYRSSFDLTVKF